jgi:hypothetical protein
MPQFEPVSCRFGAPLGRYEIGEPSACVDSSISLFRVRLLGDYDDGGAYWGGYPAAPLYCARGPSYRAFARASSRGAAARLLRIPSTKLKTGKKDGLT